MNTILRRALSTSKRTLVKAGYLDSCLNPTAYGKDELIALLFEANEKELVAMAEEKLKEEKENKN